MDMRLLGPVEAYAHGRQVHLGPRKQRFVLAILALEVNQVVPVDRLVELMWPQSPPRTAVHAVRVCASRLRLVLAGAGATPAGAGPDGATPTGAGRDGATATELVGSGGGYVLAAGVPTPPVDDAVAALAWLDAERHNLVSVCGHTAAHGWSDYSTRVATTLFRYLDPRGSLRRRRGGPHLVPAGRGRARRPRG